MRESTIRRHISNTNKQIGKADIIRKKLINKRDDLCDKLAIMLREKYEDLGFVNGAIIKHKKLGTKHSFDVMFLDKDDMRKEHQYVLHCTPPPGIPNDGKNRFILPKSIEEFEFVSSPEKIKKK